MFYLSIAAILLLFLSVAPLTHVALPLPFSGLNGSLMHLYTSLAVYQQYIPSQ